MVERSKYFLIHQKADVNQAYNTDPFWVLILEVDNLHGILKLVLPYMSFAVYDFLLKNIDVNAVNLPTFSPMQAASFRNLNGDKKKIIFKK